MEPKNLVSKSKLLFFDFFLLSLKDTIPAKYWKIESSSALLKKLNLFILFSFLGLNLFSQTYDIKTNNGQTINTCSGSFYDSGGPGNTPATYYKNNENYTVTFCSQSGENLRFDFSKVFIRSGDVLTVYDGPDISSPVLGSYSGDIIFGGIPDFSVFSSGTCLTFNFKSDANFPRDGWEAIISCFSCTPPVTSSVLPVTTPVCAGTTYTYSVDYHPGSIYNWTVTYGTPASVIGGTNTLDVTWDYFGDLPGKVVVEEVNSCGSDFSSRPVDIYPQVIVDFTGLNSSYCLGDAPVTLTGIPAGGLFTGPGISGNIFTPSVAGTGTHNIIYTYKDPWSLCINTKDIQTTVNLNTLALTSAAGTDNQTVCINTPITNITYTTTIATGATFSGLPAGVTGAFAGNVVTISGSPSVSAGSPYNYSVTLTGGCGLVTATGTIRVTPDNTINLTSAAGTIAQTVCVNTAIANITYATTGATGASFSGLPIGVTGAFAGNVVTITGSPSVSAGSPYNYTVTLTGGCGLVTATGTIRVTPDNTISLTSPAGTDAQTVCVNTAITNITYATTGATGATVSGLPAGVTGSWAANVVTISGTPTASGPFSYTITLTGGCGIATAAGTITVTPTNSISLTSAPATRIQSVCLNTSIINITYATTGATGATVTGLPAGVTGTWAANVVTISGSPTVAGLFPYTVTLSGGCGIITATGTITVRADNTINLTSAAGTDNQVVCVNIPITTITYATTGATGANFSGMPAGMTVGWVANVVTISGTPSSSGVYDYVIQLTGGCGVVTTTGRITVNPRPIVTNKLAIICSGNAFTVTPAGVPAGTTYTWTAPVVTGGITGGSAQPVGQTSISQTLTNPTLIAQTATYTVTPTSGSCAGATFTVTVTVNPVPAVTDQTATICSGNAFTVIPAGVPAGTTYTWTAPVVTGGITGGSAQVTGQVSISQTLTNPTPVDQTATYTVTPSSGTCAGATFTVTVTVNPKPVITNQITTICSGNAFTVTPAGVPAGTTYTWTAPVVTGGMTGGSAQPVGQTSISQTLTNPTPVNQTARYTVTPTSGACAGATFLVTVTVNPAPVVANKLATICSGNTFTVTPAGVPAGTTYTWTAPVVTGGITGGSAQPVGQTSISQTLINPTLVVQTATYTVTPTLGACPGATFTVTVTVNPVPAVANQITTICSGNAFTVTPAGVPAGTTYTWTAPVVTGGITGGSAQATGQGSISQTLTNPTLVVQTATYTVTPTSGTCAGATFTVTVTVNPTPAVANQTATICSGNAFTVTPAGVPAGTTYTWTAPVVTGGITGGSAQATGQISISQTLTNPTVVPRTATYTVTPTSGTCAGATFTVTVTVNPTPAVVNQTATICSANAFTVTPAGVPAGTTYTWTAPVVTGGITGGSAQPVGQTSISQTLTNPTLVPQTATYTVTPTSGTCAGATFTVTITVNPANSVSLTSPAGTDAQTVCVNTAITSITYATTGATGATVSGLPAGVTGSWAANVVTISGTPTASGPFSYTITLTGGCGIATAAGTITVTPTNSISLTSAPATRIQSVCLNTSIINITYATTGATGATVTGLPAGVTGTWAANVVTISGSPTVAGLFPYTVTLSGGCGIITATGTITVRADNTINLTSAAGTDNQVVCVNIPITTITYATTGATGANFSGMPAGMTVGWVANVVTISGTPSSSGVYDYVIQLTGGCGVVTTTGRITVNPRPIVTNKLAIICSGNAFTVTPAGVPAGTTYTWTAPVVTGGITGGSAQPVGQTSISQTLTNPTLIAQTATYTVTPTSGSCAGATFTVTVTVNPVPAVTDQTATICSGSAFTVIPAGVPAGTRYTWTAPLVTGGITGGSAQATSQLSISQTLTNPTLVAQTATYTVTPASGTCSGATFTVTVTVNPTPVIANQTTTICSGNAFTVTPAGVPAGTTYTWTAPVVTGGMTGGSAQPVGQTSISQTLTNPTPVNQTARYTVTPTSGTCAGATFLVTVTVNPAPVVTNKLATICSGNTFTVTPAGVPAGTTYTWTAPVVTGGITGGSAQPVGQTSISQTLINPTLVVQTATYTVTPTLGACPGATFTVTVTVNPVPAVANQITTICSGNAFTVTPAGVPAGTTYTWTAPVVTGGITGGSAQATGQGSISQTLTNPTLVVQTATYTVTPTSGTCAGATFTVTVTVNPTPAVANQTATICSGNAFTVTPAGVPAGTTYTWTAPVVTGGITGGSAQATGQISISQTLTNPTLVTQTATYTVTPLSGTCAGATFTVTVTVNPVPVVINQIATICSGNAFTVAPAGVPAGTTYTWTAPVVTGGITGGSAQPVGQTSISQTLTNPTLVDQTATYTVTPVSGTCAGATFTITVTVNPTPVITNQITTICSGNAFTITPAGVPAGTTYTWTAPVVTGGMTGSSAQATGQTSISQTLTNPTLVVQTATYTVTPTSGTCAGATFTVTVTVNLTPAVTNQTATICSGNAFTVTPAGVPAGTTYTWTAPVVTGGITGSSAQATGQTSISQTLTNPTLVVQTATYTVTPLSGTCAGANFTVTVTVDPVPAVMNQTATICSANAFTVTPAGVPAGTTYTWADPIVTGGITGGSAQAAGQASISQTLTNPTLVVQTATYTVTPLSGTCSGATFTITVTVNPVPAIIDQTATICSGNAFTTTPAGVPAGTTYTWTDPVVTGGITGGSAQAVGQTSISQTLTNPTFVAQTATYTVTPLSGTCAGANFTITVTVDPVPAIVDQTATICSGNAFTTTPAGVPAGTTYTWTDPIVTGGITGGSAQATGQTSISQTLTNPTLVAQTATYTITPTSGTCVGATFTITVTVNPTNSILLTSPGGTDAQTVCINTAIADIKYATTGATGAIVTGLPAGITGTWLADEVTISGTPTVSGTFAYTITLTGGCGLITSTGTIIINPVNTINLTSTAGTDGQTVCVNTAITDITYATTGATGATVTGLPAGVTGTWLADVVTISGSPTVAGPFTYTVTLTGGCEIVTTTGTISAMDDNVINISSAIGTDGQTVCNNTAIENITYSTTGATGATVSGLPAGVTGTWSSDVVTISGIPTVSGPFTYTVTLTGGCGVITTTGTINVSPDNTIILTSVAGTDDQTICLGTPITDITYATTGSTGAIFSGLPAGMLYTIGVNTITITGTPGTYGVFDYSITLTGGCGVVVTNGTIVINPDNSIDLTSAAGTDNQTACINSPITDITYLSYIASGATFTGLPAGVTGTWTGGAVTISGIPTVQGLFNYTITLTGGCGMVTTSGAITVTADNTVTLTSGAGSDAQTVCSSSAITDITYATTGATGATVSGLPAGVSGSWAADVVTITGTPTASGPFTYTITLTGGCGVITATGTITVAPDNTILLTSATGTDAQSICSGVPITDITYATTGATGASVSGLPAGVTGVWAADVFTISGSTTVLGISAYTISLTGGCGVVSVDGTITVNTVPSLVITNPLAQCAPSTIDLTTAAITAGSTAGLDLTYWTDALATVSYTTPVAATAGTYYIKGADPLTNCYDIKPVIVTIDPVPVLTITDPVGVCTPLTVDLTGVSVTAGSTAGLILTYWTDALATINYPTPGNATAGTYYIKGTDPVTNCYDIKPVTATVHPLPSIIINDPSGCAPSTVDLTAASVTAGSTAGLVFTYWTDALATISYTTPATATAGTYYIEGTDPVTGCNDIKPVTVTINPALTVTTTQVDAVCFNGTGTATVIAAGGSGVYTYSWNTIPVQTNAAATLLSAGSYTVTVTDGSCTASADVTINQPATALSAITSHTNVSLQGGNNGSITVSGSGGTSPYMYSLNGGAYQVSGTFGTLTAGTYTVAVQDINLCPYVVPVTIMEPTSGLSGSITSIPVGCFGDLTGSLTVAGSGGFSPYEYSIDGGITFQSSDTFVNLPAGPYTVTIRDAGLITAVLSTTISQPASALTGSVLPTNVLCFGGNTGTLTVSGSGGTPPYMYKIGTGSYQVSGTFDNLAVGSYKVSVKDANMCSVDIDATIDQPSAVLTLSPTITNNVTCLGSADGSVNVAGSGGTFPYMYSINGGTYQASNLFSNLTAATYTLSVLDANLCPATTTVAISEPTAITITNTNTDASCPEVPDGSITLTVAGGTQPYSAIWSDGVLTQDRPDIADGPYSVVITDKNLCAASLDIVLGVIGSESCLEIPTIITPNNDGANDTWKIKNIDLFPDAEVFVFTRWGKLVFHSKNLSANQWDGTFNGTQLPTDSYHYILHLNNGYKPRSGVISIIR